MGSDRPPESGARTPPPWYRRAFGRYYPIVYAHRDDEEAERAVRLFLPHLPSGRVLDLACGTGRHLRALGRAGVSAIGLDASQELLSIAREQDPRARLVRGDMQALPFRSAQFAAVMSLFSSFGYFETDAEDLRVLSEAARVLTLDGALVLDLSNPAVAREGVGGATRRESSGYRIDESRTLSPDGRRIMKRVRIRRGAAEGDALVDDYTESLRLYERAEIEAIVTAWGFRVAQAWGDYSGRPLASDAPRMVLVFRKDPRSAEPKGR